MISIDGGRFIHLTQNSYCTTFYCIKLHLIKNVIVIMIPNDYQCSMLKLSK